MVPVRSGRCVRIVATLFAIAASLVVDASGANAAEPPDEEPINENFDAGSTVPAGWTERHDHPPGEGTAGVQVWAPGDNVFFFEGPADNGDQGTWVIELEAPPLDLSGATSVQLSYWLNMSIVERGGGSGLCDFADPEPAHFFQVEARDGDTDPTFQPTVVDGTNTADLTPAAGKDSVSLVFVFFFGDIDFFGDCLVTIFIDDVVVTADDGLDPANDNCDNVANVDQANAVHPGTLEGDACDDPDSDLVADLKDNCPDHANPDQTDVDRDGRGDACDSRDDRPTCGGKKATIWLDTDGTITGTSGPDVVVGTPKSDFLKGRGGNDALCGGAGRDLLKGGGGNDFLNGGRGHDVCLGGPGRNKLRSC